MIGSVLFCVAGIVGAVDDASLPTTCREGVTPDDCEENNLQDRIHWTECGGRHLRPCSVERCCTHKATFNKHGWSDELNERTGTYHVDALVKSGESLLMAAARNNKANIVAELISQHASVNLQDKYGGTALILASLEGNDAIVKSLLKAGACVAITDVHNATALQYAVESGNVKVVELLLNKCAKVDQKALDSAASREGISEELKRSQENPLIAAVLRKSVDGLMHMINNTKTCLDSSGKNINSTDADGLTALWHATNLSSTPLVEILLRNFANIGTELDLAAENGYVEVGRKLVDAGAKASDDTLVKAVKGKHFSFVQFLLEDERVSADVSTGDGIPVLILAVENKNEDIVEILLEHGTPVDARDAGGKPALLLAVEKNNMRIVQTLLNYSASVDLTSCPGAQDMTCKLSDKTCDSALTAAMKSDYKEIVDLLFDAGADVNQKFCMKSKNFSSLTWAATFRYVDVVEELLHKCVDIEFKTEEKTALMIATNHARIELLFKEAMKKPCYKNLVEESKAGQSMDTAKRSDTNKDQDILGGDPTGSSTDTTTPPASSNRFTYLIVFFTLGIIVCALLTIGVIKKYMPSNDATAREKEEPVDDDISYNIDDHRSQDTMSESSLDIRMEQVSYQDSYP